MSSYDAHNNLEHDSSEEDEDYVPENNFLDEDKPKRKRGQEEDTSNKKPQICLVKTDELSPLEQAKKLRRDELWKQLNSKVATSKSPLVSSSFSLSALCLPMKTTGNAQIKKLQDKPFATAAKAFSQPAAKPRSQMSDANKLAIAAAALSAVRESTSTTGGSLLGLSGTGRVPASLSSRDDKVGSIPSGSDSRPGTLPTGDNGPSAVPDSSAKPKPAAGSGSGLDAVLADLEKKKKATVLDQTRRGWTDFKSQNQNVDEELENYKRSSGQFLDRQEFLRRAELREYEIERDKRLASDVRTRGRV